jgi:DNA ligase-1
MRCIYDGAGGLWTRSGKPIAAPASLVDALPKGTALDGELWLGRGKFQETMSVVRRMDAPPHEWAKVTYTVFDAPRAPGGIESRLAAAKTALASSAAAAPPAAAGAAAPPRVELLPQEVCRGREHVLERLAEVEQAGGEGLMLRHPSAAHRGGRTSELLKVKSFKDDEALVVGHEPGKGKHAGRLGALACRDREGKAFKVGTGFTDAQRESPPPVGAVVTFNFFERTNAGVPRFPSFNRVRPDVSAAEFA